MTAATRHSTPLDVAAAFKLRGAGSADTWEPRDSEPERDALGPDLGRLIDEGQAGASRPPSPQTSKPSLPWQARLYVGAVIVAGAVLAVAFFPRTIPDPVLSLGLLALVLLGSALKVQLPVPRSSATLSVSFIADFMALILVGPSQAMVLAGLGALAQCLVHRRGRPAPLYRVVFSMSALVITVQVTNLAYSALGGQTGLFDPNDLATPVIAGAFAYFICNGVLVAVAAALATGQSPWRVWADAFLWSGVSFVAGAGIAVAAAWFIEHREAWSALMLAAPVYLTYRTYHVYLGHIANERRHAAEVSALNTQAMRALDQARRSERALALEKERLGVTLGSIGDAVLATDTRGRVVLLNHTAEQFTGWNQDEAVGTPVADVFRLVDRDTGKSYVNPVDKVLRTETLVDRDQHAALASRDGSQRLVEHSATPVRDQDGAVVAVVLVARDMTEAVLMEAERTRASKLAALGVLAGGIAHDFNNILTAIVGNISLAQLDDGAGSQRANLADAERACFRAKGLTQQLLTFSKGGAPVKKLVLLQDVIREAAGFAVRGSNVKCVFDVADDLWAVDADENQIVQVVNNLVINAVQAMPEGGTVEIRASNVVNASSPADAGTPNIEIAVRDHGVGIQAEHLGKIFDPYFSTKAVGNGLGLATSYSIIANHGGAIAVESAPGRGTTMTVTLPSVGAACRAAAADRRAEPARGRGRVLIMDDEEPIRDVARAMLSRLGYRVEVAADGLAAVERYRDALKEGDRFDAVLMDLTIPGGMGGKAAIKELLALDPGATAIVSSGYADAPVMAEFEQYGFKGVVPKPFTIAELSRLLQQVMQSASA